MMKFEVGVKTEAETEEIVAAIAARISMDDGVTKIFRDSIRVGRLGFDEEMRECWVELFSPVQVRGRMIRTLRVFPPTWKAWQQAHLNHANTEGGPPAARRVALAMMNDLPWQSLKDLNESEDQLYAIALLLADKIGG